MTLNIKNPEAHRLARELAALTGESMTVAVTEAIRERLARVRRERQAPAAARLLAIGKDCAAHLKEPSRSIDHADQLYGADGLPS
jgi:antitoxin VapB